MQDILLNLIPGACSPEVHLSQYDKGRVIPFKLADGKSAYDVPAGSTMVVKATKPSGLGFIVPVSFEGDTATMTITETMSNEYGRFPAELSITNGDTLIGTANFVLNVEKSPHPEGTTDGDSDSLIPELTLLVERIEDAAESIHDLSVIGTPLTPGQPPTAEYDSEENEINFGLSTANSIVSIALLSTSGTTKTYRITFTNGTHYDFDVTDGEITEEALEEILSDYALQNGYYDELTAGSAEQLLSSQFVEDSVPYKFRTSGGSADIGNREYDEIVGGSIVWNQLVKNGNFADLTNWAKATNISAVSIAVANNVLTQTISAGSTEPAYKYGILQNNIVSNDRTHKYLATITVEPSVSTDFALELAGLSKRSSVVNANTKKVISFITTYGTQTNSFMSVYPFSAYHNISTVDSTIKYSNAMVVDLTQMFGSQVADYIYSLETAQSGKGVAFFKSLFPNDYYPYNAGELLSVEGLQSHDMVGFNALVTQPPYGYQFTFDRTKATKVLKGQKYQYTFENVKNATNWRTVLNVWDLDGNKIEETTGEVNQQNAFTTIPARFYASNLSNPYYPEMSNGTLKEFEITFNQDCYVMFGIFFGNASATTEVENACLHLVWSGWRNGEYEPYKKHSYPLDSSLTLRGIPKLNSQNELYFDGDIYSHNGNMDRRLAEVDMGSLNWSRTASYTRGVFYTNLTGAKTDSYNTDSNLLNVKYTATTRKNANELATAGDKLICLNGGTNQLLVTDDSYTTAGAFKTAMSGVMLIYELATPTEETAEPFDEIQLVDDFGTEEYISGNLVPVGHNTKYPANLRDKLQHLPDLPSGDGYYLIQVSGTQMTLNPFRIPMMPTTDGTYTLKCTVSGGTPTASWEAVE